MSKKVVYLCHPVSAPTPEGIKANLRAAREWFRWATIQGVAVVADWITMVEEFDDGPAERARGIECDLALVERCDEVWLVGGRVSSGMKAEADHAKTFLIPVVDKTDLGAHPPRGAS